jgi:hypothetical protein
VVAVSYLCSGYVLSETIAQLAASGDEWHEQIGHFG